MKQIAFISPSGLAFTPAALNTVLAGRGNPPSCPVWSAANPGCGSVPMNPAVIDVQEAAEVYEQAAPGSWRAVKDTADLVDERGGVIGKAYLARHIAQVSRANLSSVEEIRAGIETEKTQKTAQK